MPSPRSFEWVRIQTTKPTYPKNYFLLGFRPLSLENVENQNIHTCPFYVECAVFVSQFRGFRLQCTFMSLFALQCRYYLRSGAGNIASNQTHLVDVMLYCNKRIYYMPSS